MDEEAIFGEVLPIAQAVRNSGGIVIAQVARLLDHPAHPQLVKVPGILVDRIVVATPEEHEQTFAERFNSGYCAPLPENDRFGAGLKPMAPGTQRIIAARICDEIPHGAVVNLGIGMPEGVARVAAERGLLDQFVLTVESGPIGGIPAGGLVVSVEQDRLRIIREGHIRKFTPQVEQISFNAQRALEQGQEVLYITERAVFRLTDKGLELIEAALGIDIDQQILAGMAFRPIMNNVGTMPAHLFE